MLDKQVYFIPGRGENLDAGLGRLIESMGYTVHGREIVADFARLRFAAQLAEIRSDLQPAWWHAEAVLIGHSYGAYLLLHTLADLTPFPGKILLCSPVLGAAVAKDGFFGSRPPRAERLVRLAESNTFPAPRHLEIHTGAHDNGCDPRLAARFASLVGNTKLSIVAGAGHLLGEEYLRDILRTFLSVDECNASCKATAAELLGRGPRACGRR